MNLMPTFWDFVKDVAYPVAHTHDRYWEDACGARRPPASLTGDWIVEHPWRVGTINPGGRDALERKLPY